MNRATMWLGAIGALTLSAPAHAGILELSEFSSDSTPASELSAVLDFSLSGSTLTLQVTNNSLFDIVGIAFNGDDSFSLTPTSANITGDESTGWAFGTNDAFDGFGVFDFALTTSIMMGSSLLPPGDTEIFEFTINGSAGMNDFVSNKSTNPPGNQQAKAAAKFQSGPNGDSAFGACLECDGDDTTTMIPLPSAAGMGLLGIGCVTLTRRRRSA